MPHHLPHLDLYDKTRGKIRNAYILAILTKCNELELAAFARLYNAGDYEGAVGLLKLDESIIDDVVEEIRISYRKQGQIAIDELRPPPEIREVRSAAFTFSILGNVHAERWLLEESSRLIVDVVHQQRQLARSLISENVARGNGPREVAQQLVGFKVKDGPNKGKRRGGIIGLTRKQSEWVQNAKNEIAGSGSNPLIPLDKEQLYKYLTRRLRDKRFDGAVRKAIRTGVPIPKETQDKMNIAYRSRFLKYRGETIGRTESLRAMGAARRDAMQSVVDKGGIKDPENIDRIWHATLGSVRTRDTHIEANGQTRKLTQPFEVGGEFLDYPGDPAGKAEETINCRCYVEHKVDWIAEKLGLPKLEDIQ